MNIYEKEKCFNHSKSVVWNTAESPKQWILYRNQAPISLTHFGMWEARVGEIFYNLFIYFFVFLIFFCPFGANKDTMDFSENFVCLGTLKKTQSWKWHSAGIFMLICSNKKNEPGLFLIDLIDSIKNVKM